MINMSVSLPILSIPQTGEGAHSNESNKILLCIGDEGSRTSIREPHFSTSSVTDSLVNKGLIRNEMIEPIQYTLEEYKKNNRLAVIKCHGSTSPCLELFSRTRGEFGDTTTLEKSINLSDYQFHQSMVDYDNEDFVSIHFDENANTTDTEHLLTKTNAKNGIDDCYIKNVLLKEVNRYGKPVIRLKLIAWLAEKLFGIYGVGQTNSASCAKSVVDTVQTKILHRAMPKAKGADATELGIKNMELKCCGSIQQLAIKLAKNKKNINGVLVIPQNTSWGRSFFRPTREHICNVVTINNQAYLIDSQRRKHCKVDLSDPHEKLIQTLKGFIGAIGEGDISLYDAGLVAKKSTFS